MLKPTRHDFYWMAAGATILLVFMLVVMHFQKNLNPAVQAALQAKKTNLVERMRLALTVASEAEKSAVLAITDQDSQSFANQARTSTAEVERMRKELAELLQTNGTAREKDSLTQFSAAFVELQNIDKELLDLAVKNTNIKAYNLAYGTAADALRETDTALSQIIATAADLPESKKIMFFAFSAETAALRIQAMLPQHIAEESDQKMGAMEEAMSSDANAVHKNLDGLAAISRLHNNPALETATRNYAKYDNIRTQIIALSRENSNVRSLTLSLNQKRKISLLCQASLSVLLEATREEPIISDVPASPR
jgi:hypothetical protein